VTDSIAVKEDWSIVSVSSAGSHAVVLARSDEV
jgi:hypothetical protein